jgi:NAD(P)H-dependent flavin oxidoreductase YrpB (nitropropane dioxygenase family)
MSNAITMSTAAALPAIGAPSFVVSTGVPAWSGDQSKHGAYGTPVQGLRLVVDTPNPTVARARVATKQDRPPRGVPR